MKVVIASLLSLCFTKSINAQVDDGLKRKLLIRCIPSIDTSKSPLVIVNQKAVSFTTLNSINPNDIDKVNVIKPPKSEELYGSAGIKGAIIVQLKDSTAIVEDIIVQKTFVGITAIKTCLSDAMADNSINLPIFINGTEFSNKSILKKVIPEEVASINIEILDNRKQLIVMLKPGTRLML